jgi:hypothetical protein
MNLTNISLANEAFIRQKYLYWLDAQDIGTIVTASEINWFSYHYTNVNQATANATSDPGSWSSASGNARPVLKWTSKINPYHFVTRPDILVGYEYANNGYATVHQSEKYDGNPFYSAGNDAYAINGKPAIFNPQLTNLPGGIGRGSLDVKCLLAAQEYRGFGFSAASATLHNNPVSHGDFTLFVVMKAQNYNKVVEDASLLSMGYTGTELGSFQLDAGGNSGWSSSTHGFLGRIKYEGNDYARYVDDHTDLIDAYNDEVAAGDTRTKEHWGRDHWLANGQNNPGKTMTRTATFPSGHNLIKNRFMENRNFNPQILEITYEANLYPASNQKYVTMKGYRNGNSSDGNKKIDLTSNAEIFPNPLFRIFANRGGGKSFPCSIGELIVINSVDSADRNYVREYLSGKWGISIA